MRQMIFAMLIVFATLSWAQQQKEVSLRAGKFSSFLKADSAQVHFTSKSSLLMNYKNSLSAQAGTALKSKSGLSKEVKSYKAEGGVSDGGGNAVGGAFFDYYENKGTIRLSPQAVVQWNATTFNLFKKIHAMVPVTLQGGKPQGKSFGELLEAAIATKVWYLEPKPLEEAGCLNDSFIYVVDRMVVGCQNDFEVRLNANWILNVADDANQAGLILHEVLLNWARANDDEPVKSNLEYKVRDLNRLAIEADSAQFVTRLNEHYRMLKALNTQEGSLYKMIPQIEKQSIAEMCVGQPFSSQALIHQMKSHPILKWEIQSALAAVEELSKPGTRDLQEKKAIYCLLERPGTLDSNSLSPACKEKADESFASYRQQYQGWLEGNVWKPSPLWLSDVAQRLIQQGCHLQVVNYLGYLKANQNKKAGN